MFFEPGLLLVISDHELDQLLHLGHSPLHFPGFPLLQNRSQSQSFRVDAPTARFTRRQSLWDKMYVEYNNQLFSNWVKNAGFKVYYINIRKRYDIQKIFKHLVYAPTTLFYSYIYIYKIKKCLNYNISDMNICNMVQFDCV